MKTFLAFIGGCFVVGCLFLFLLVAAVYFSSQKQTEGRNPPPAQLAYNTPIEPVILRATVLNHQWNDGDSPHFTGLVTNNTGETISWLKVEYSLFDFGGSKIGSSTDFITDLAPHETWRFKAGMFEKDMKQYRFEGLTMGPAR